MAAQCHTHSSVAGRSPGWSFSRSDPPGFLAVLASSAKPLPGSAGSDLAADRAWGSCDSSQPPCAAPPTSSSGDQLTVRYLRYLDPAKLKLFMITQADADRQWVTALPVKVYGIYLNSCERVSALGAWPQAEPRRTGSVNGIGRLVDVTNADGQIHVSRRDVRVLEQQIVPFRGRIITP